MVTYRISVYAIHVYRIAFLVGMDSKCFDTVFRRPYRCFSIALKETLSLSDLHKIFTSDSVGCLWHSHGKNPVRLYPKLQSQPIGLSKIFIDYLFFQADQSDCTKSVSIFNRFAFSEESRNQNVPCQICRP